MSNLLKNVAVYSKSKISLDEINLDTYVTTDNLLQNKQGKIKADKMPKQLSSKVTKFDKGDILIANIRPYLKKIWLAEYTGGSSTDVLTLKVNEDFNSTFVFYSLLRDEFFDHMMKGSKGTKMPRGDKNQILEFPIPKFDKKIQKQIAKVLSDLDAKIEINNKINKELEAMAKTIYDYWFVQFDFPMSKKQAAAIGKPELAGKPYKSSGGKMVYNEELKREIPAGWEVKKLKVIAKTGSGGTPLKSKNEYYENGNIPWINSGEVNESFIITAKKYITKLGLEKSSAKLFPKGTILMAMYGATAGQVSLIDIEACTNQAICGINPKDEKFKYYVKFSLEDMYEYLVNLSTGSARDNLSQDKIKELNLIIPRETLISDFHNKVKSNFDCILLNLKQNQELASLRDWLLPMLMNGQVTISEAQEQVEEKLELEADYRINVQPNITTNQLFSTLTFDHEVAAIVYLTESKFGLHYGKKYIHKMFSNIQMLSALPKIKNLQFEEKGWGMFSKGIATTLNNPKRIRLVTLESGYKGFKIYKDAIQEVKDWIRNPDNQLFINEVHHLLDIYDRSPINRSMDKIELLNTVLACINSLKTYEIIPIYDKMKLWKMEEKGYECKADKFSKKDAKEMIDYVKKIKT